MDSKESHIEVPRLMKWGGIVTSKMYATNSELTDEQQQSIMAILHSIENEESGNILEWIPVPGKLEVVLCFPYALGFSCEEEKVPSTVVDLNKPILILATSTHCLTDLENHLSSSSLNEIQPFLQRHHFLSVEDITEGAYYKVYTVQNETDATQVMIENYDIVLSDFQCSFELPERLFSIVLVYGDHELSKEQLNYLESIAEHVKVVLFTTPAYEDSSEVYLSEETSVSQTNTTPKKQPSMPKLVQKQSSMPTTRKEQPSMPKLVKKHSSMPTTRKEQPSTPKLVKKHSRMPATLKEQPSMPKLVQKQSSMPTTRKEQPSMSKLVKKHSSMPTTRKEQPSMPKLVKKQSSIPTTPKKQPSMPKLVKKQSSMPKLVKYAEEITKTDRMMTLLNKRQLSVLYKVAEQIQAKQYSDYPFVVSMEPNKGEVEMLCFLPYFLGKGWLYNHTEQSNIDMSKPMLIIANHPETLSKLKKYFCDKPYLVESGYLEHDELEKGILYKAHVVQDNFDAVTISNLTDHFDIILSIKDYYQSFPTDCFSVIVVFESNLLSKAEEQDIIYTFENTKTILFRVTSHEPTEKFAAEVVSRLTYIQEYGDKIMPKLVQSGKRVKEKIFSSSILTEQQKLGLRTIVDWFVYPDSQHQPAQIDTSIGYEQAGVMVYCLPYMLGWGVSTRLIDEEELQLNKPILLLCSSADTLNQLWELFYVNPVFVKSFVLSTDPADPLYNVYLVNSNGSAKQARQEAISNDVMISPVEYLNALPDESFSAVVCYTFGTLEEDLQKQTIQKFDRYSKLIFINVSLEAQIETIQKHKDPLKSVLIKFGGVVMNKQLFGKESSIDTQIIDGLKDIVRWFSQSDTKNLPIAVSGTSNSKSDNIIISCLPYMFGWAINENIIPSEEVDLNKPILILVYDNTALDNLRTILCYPFLTKCGILDTSLIQDGAYYNTKFVLKNDFKGNAEEIVNGYDIVVAEAKCDENIPIELFSLVVGYSSETVDLSIQQKLENKLEGKVNLLFFQGTVALNISSEEVDPGDSQYVITNEAMYGKKTTYSYSSDKNSNEGIMERHSKFTISKLKWFDNKRKDTDAEGQKQTQFQPKKRRKRNKQLGNTADDKHSSNRRKSKHNKTSLEGPYYRCECGREIEATNIMKDSNFMKGAPRPSAHQSCYSSLPRGFPVLGMGLCSDCMHSVGVNHSNQQPQYLNKSGFTAERTEKEIIGTRIPETILTERSETNKRFIKANSLAEQVIPKEVQSYKVGKTYYLKFIKISNNTKGVQARIESVTKNLLYKQYSSKYYKELEKAHLTQCFAESHVQNCHKKQTEFRPSIKKSLEEPELKYKWDEKQKTKQTRRDTFDIAELSQSKSKDRLKEEWFLEHRTLHMSHFDKVKRIIPSLDKLVGVDKTEHGEQTDMDENRNTQYFSVPIIQNYTQKVEIPRTSSAEGYFTENIRENKQENKWNPICIKKISGDLQTSDIGSSNQSIDCDQSSTKRIVEYSGGISEVQHMHSKKMKKIQAKSTSLLRKHDFRFWHQKNVDNKETSTESIKTDKSTSFHLNKFLQENEEQIQTCPEEVLKSLIQSTTAKTDHQTSLDRRIPMPKYFSDCPSYKPKETLSGIEMSHIQKRKSSNSHILESCKDTEEESPYDTTSQQKLHKKHIEVDLKHDSHDKQLLSYEILALRNVHKTEGSDLEDMKSDEDNIQQHPMPMHSPTSQLEAEIEMDKAQESRGQNEGETGIFDTTNEQLFREAVTEGGSEIIDEGIEQRQSVSADVTLHRKYTTQDNYLDSADDTL